MAKEERKTVGILFLALVFLSMLVPVASFAAETGGVSTPSILFFCGGRLFSSGQLKKSVASSGCQLTFLDTRELAGFGGSIKKYETDEPEKRDGITPEFARLSNYDLVYFSCLSEEDMAGILTEERVARLKEYVSGGGALLLDIQAPASLGDLLPVTFRGNPQLGRRLKAPEGTPKNIMRRPPIPEVSDMPEQWQKFTRFRRANVCGNAGVLSWIVRENGDSVAPGVVSMAYGKGRVVFMNGQWSFSSNASDFSCWCYSDYFIRGLMSFAMGKPLQNSHVTIPSRKVLPPLDETSLEFRELTAAMKTNGTVTVSGKHARFNDAAELTLGENALQLRFKGVEEPFVLAYPVIKVALTPQDLNGDDSEAQVKTYDLQELKIKWESVTAERGEGVFAVRFKSSDAELLWEFVSGKLFLDGRVYGGYGDRIKVLRLPVKMQSVQFNSVIPNGTVRRNTCYTSPRGYLEARLGKGEGQVDTTKTWQFFCSGQPFTYLYLPGRGIVTEFVDSPVPCYTTFMAGDSDGELKHDLRLLAGRRKAPVELPVVWHLFSRGEEHQNNEYIALYQYARKHLRERCGIGYFPQVTMASYYLHGRKNDDLKVSAELAAKLNFKSVWLSLCPLQMTEIDGKRLADVMGMVKDLGLQPIPWTAGGYNHKDSNPIFKGHPDWFIRKNDGSFHRYFKTLPVGDFNNREFRGWFLKQVLKAKDNGMARIYHDMAGEISNQVNYFPEDGESATGLDGFILLLKEYQKHGIPCAVEGMNPLAKDQALFAPLKAYPLEGKEFAYVGGTPLASVDNGQANALFPDYFRLLMFNATINIDVDGYRFNVERVPDEQKLMEEISQLNPLFNRAFEYVPEPFVRETAFGSSWVDSKAGKGALFFERGVKKLTLTLPQGWRVADGASLENIGRHSVILLER